LLQIGKAKVGCLDLVRDVGSRDLNLRFLRISFTFSSHPAQAELAWIRKILHDAKAHVSKVAVAEARPRLGAADAEVLHRELRIRQSRGLRGKVRRCAPRMLRSGYLGVIALRLGNETGK